MERSIKHLREEYKQLKEGIEELLKREEEVRKRILFYIIAVLISYVILFIVKLLQLLQ